MRYPEAADYLGIPVSTLRAWVAGQMYRHKGEARSFQAIIRPADPKTHAFSFI